MGKRGPAANPTQLKLLQGVRPSRINDAEPIPAKTDVAAPEWLPDDAREVWAALAPDLIAKNILTSWDIDTFADVCALIVVNRQALADVNRNGATVTTLDRVLSDGTKVYRLQRNPAWQIVHQSAQLLVTLGGRFGLNPSDRASLRVEIPGLKGAAERYLS